MLHAHLYGYGINRGGGAPTYALLGDGALYASFAATQVLAAGDTITVPFYNTFDNSGGAAGVRVFDGTVLSRQALTQTNLNKVNVAGAMTAELDGVAVVPLTTPFPMDGLRHEFVCTITGPADLSIFFANYDGASNFGQMAIPSITVNSAARGTERWVLNGSSTTVVPESLLGTGSDLNLTGVAAEDFVTVPL